MCASNHPPSIDPARNKCSLESTFEDGVAVSCPWIPVIASFKNAGETTHKHLRSNNNCRWIGSQSEAGGQPGIAAQATSGTLDEALSTPGSQA